MASTLTINSNSYSGRKLRLYCSQKKDIATNKSTITWTLYSEGGTANYYSTGPTTVKINGTTVYSKVRVDWTEKVFPAATGSTSGTISIDHNTDGSKKISVSLSTVIYDDAGSVKTYSSDWTLDSIPRKATATSASNFTDTGNPTVSFDNPGSLQLRPYFNIYNDAGTLVFRLYRDKGTYSSPYTFVLSDSEREEMRNACNSQSEYINTWVGVETYTGSTKLGYSSKQVTFTITNANPVVTMNVSVNNGSLSSAFNNLWIQGKSKANVTLSAVGKYNASIKSYYAVIDGKTYNFSSFTSNAIETPGNIDIKGYAKDSRSLTGSASQQINVIAYNKPLVIPVGTDSAIQCYRSDGDGKRVGNSTSVWVKAKKSYSTVTSGGTQKNFCALQWRRKLSAEVWDDSVHLWSDLITKSSTTTDEYSALIADTVFELTKSYTVQIRAIDDIGEYDVKTFDIPTQDVALHMGKGGNIISVGQYCDYSIPDSFQMNLDLYLKGETGLVKSDYIVEQGTSSGWRYRKWDSGRLEQWKIITPTFTSWAIWKNDYWYTSGGVEFTFGIPFIEQPVINATNFSTYWAIPIVDTVSTTTFSIYGVRPNAGPTFANAYYYSIYAIGKWK